MWSLLTWLPPDSPVARSIDPKGVGQGWSREANLLALLTEVTDINNVLLMYGYGGAHVEENTEVRDVIWIPRPSRPKRDMKAEEKPVLDSGEDLVQLVIETGGKAEYT